MATENQNQAALVPGDDAAYQTYQTPLARSVLFIRAQRTVLSCGVSDLLCEVLVECQLILRLDEVPYLAQVMAQPCYRGERTWSSHLR